MVGSKSARGHQWVAIDVENRSHPEQYERHKTCNDKSKIDHRVWCTIIKQNMGWMAKANSLVARANHLCCAFLLILSPSVCSEADTEPHGYSAPTPIPSKNLRVYWYQRLTRAGTTHRHALSIANIPPKLPWAPDEAAERAEKKATIPVAAICEMNIDCKQQYPQERAMFMC